MIDIKVPTVGESISEVTLLKWVKNDGEYVERDEVIAELESEKATFEVNAEQAGALKTSAKEGDTLKIGDVLASIDESAVKPAGGNGESGVGSPEANKPAVVEAQKPSDNKPAVTGQAGNKEQAADIKASPVASAIIADKKLDPKTVLHGYQVKFKEMCLRLTNPGASCTNLSAK